ncbi:hypothetical protein [Allokutzneria oryzae]|uniref:Uncharacterized protein n=1 Tax=Allokutzneria oryzae TaxID=1378989 RepID=A0ABV6A0K5_9PSEU
MPRPRTITDEQLLDTAGRILCALGNGTAIQRSVRPTGKLTTLL